MRHSKRCLPLNTEGKRSVSERHLNHKMLYPTQKLAEKLIRSDIMQKLIMTNENDNPPMFSDIAAPAEEEKSPAEPQAKRTSRRKFLKWSALAGTAAVAGAAVDALAIEPHGFMVTRYDLPIANLPGAWEGIRIAQLTDIHVGPYSSLDDARRIVQMSNDLKQDIVILTGDYVSRAKAISHALVEVLRNLRAKIGKFAVLGNHDYWADAKRMLIALTSTGIVMLTNRHHVLTRRGRRLCLAGVDDLMAGRPDLQAALSGAPEGVPRILLCHNPDYADRMPHSPKVDFMICGHTHGGQVKLPLYGPLVLPIHNRKYAEGFVEGPYCPLFISRGLGMVQYPIRFNCRPELPVFTLRRK